MPASFLPPSVAQLTESTSIALAEIIQREAITTPLSPDPIATAYARQGSSNPPILLIHGFDSSLFEYRRLLPLLAANNETWALDLLGFGFTERAPGLPFSARAIGTHLYYSWKTLISQPVILVGASMGGAAAIDFTLNHPELVKKLVLIDSAGFPVTANKGNFLIPPLGYLATSFLRNPKVRQKISINAYFDPTFASLDARTCAALHLEMPNWSQALIAFTKSGGYSGFGEKLSHIQQQTLILWGKQDRILGTADAEKFARTIPNSQLIWIPDCGHVPHLEKPQIAAQHILDFIEINDS
jgi:pimeloyl-ACP methyl ester carboxylesterase